VGKALLLIRKTSALGEERKKAILLAAENEFEKFSYGGARMQSIADKAGVPKSNVHYYFKNKRGLYNAVLEDVVNLWDQAFETLNPEDNPEIVLTRFVQKKVEFSRLYPQATRIFISEMLHGAPYLNPSLNEQMNRWTRERAEVISQWVKKGKIREIDPYHLIFMIWSSTQHFAGAEAQIKSVYGKSNLSKDDYKKQSESLTSMVMRICGLDPAS
jgi:TetR/AcrR family transcriptional regulator